MCTIREIAGILQLYHPPTAHPQDPPILMHPLYNNTLYLYCIKKWAELDMTVITKPLSTKPPINFSPLISPRAPPPGSPQAQWCGWLLIAVGQLQACHTHIECALLKDSFLSPSFLLCEWDFMHRYLKKATCLRPYSAQQHIQKERL